MKKPVKILVVEDDLFFNQLLSAQLKAYMKPIESDLDFKLQLNSYTSPRDALRNMDDTTDIIFLDYYLGESLNGDELMKKMQSISPGSYVIIMSRVNNFRTSLVSLLDGASEFILKDRNAISRCCLVAEEMVRNRLLH